MDYWTPNTTTSSQANDSKTTTPPQHEDAPVDFQAQALLHAAAALQERDGNLAQELDLLEDQVDHLLLPKTPLLSTTTTTTSAATGEDADGSTDDDTSTVDQPSPRRTSPSSNKEDANPMNWHEARQRQLDQVTRDAYSLTSPLTIPWLLRYRQALDHVTANGPHDLTACPVLCLVVCTTHEQAVASESGTGKTNNNSNTNSMTATIVETLQALQLPHYLPVPFHSGLWDPTSVSYHALVLHDQVQGPRPSPSTWEEQALKRALMQTFGSTATILRMNTIAPETAAQLAREETQDLWQGGGQCGNCLSVSDRVALRNYLTQTLVPQALWPALERRIARLNAIVSERKKGVRNVLKSFWRTGKTKEDVEQEQAAALLESSSNSNAAANAGATATSSFAKSFLGGGTSTTASTSSTHSNNNNSTVAVVPGAAWVRYRYDAIESQTRLLADTLFLLKDYEAALSTYRLIRDDYKQDKAHTHYASCQEHMALCMHLLDPYSRTREVFACLETALLSYKKAADEERAASPTLYAKATGQRSPAAPPSTRAATRLCLVLVSSATTLCAGRHLEVADLLASSSSNETALGAAVLLEQSSAHYFQNDKFRKYAFHMLMSGHMFRTAQQEHHAFRCFTSALHIYRDAQWDELHNHIRSALAAQLYSMGRMALSLQLYAQLVSGQTAPRVSIKSQQKFINHVLEICNEHPKKALAGADRMVHPISTRRERSRRIAQVIQYTKTAIRVLELPNLQLPYMDNESVMVIAEEGGGNSSMNRSTDPSSPTAAGVETAAVLGKSARGDFEVWDQLMLECIAELRAADATSNDPPMTQLLAKIDDPSIRRVLAEMDRERAHRNLTERVKKSSSYKPTPPSRALMEPLAVECTLSNPLGIPIDLVDLQIVARMTAKSDKNMICTNEDAIQITPLASRNELRKWTFHSSTLEFSVPQFCRVAQETKSSGGDGDSNNKEDISPLDDALLKRKWKSAYEVDPFFVVTKTALTLVAESSQTISASICPLVEGDLEILGIRCRLLDSVWMFHPFCVKGELLQNTRSNRVHRVRAESLLLKAKVERGMPCLTADFVQPLTSVSSVKGEPGPLLQGQVSKWNLRLTNVGTAPAKSITVKTNVPWITIWDGGDENRAAKSHDELERQATSYCVGPTGTLMRIPIDGFGLQVDGEIHPGESVDVAVDLRTYGAGRQDFYMLFRYELVEPKDATVPCRWLRKMLQVPLYPSLSLNATLVPSYAKEAEHVLSVEVTNYRSDQPEQLHLLVDQLTLASRSYKLQPLPGQIVASDGQVRLGWQERVTLHYRVLPLDEPSSTCLLSQSILSTGSTNRTLSLQASSSSLLHFLCLERAHAQFEETRLSHQRALARAAAAGGAGDGEESQHPRSISQIRRANTNQSSLSEEALETVELPPQAQQGSVVDSSSVVVAPTSIRKLAPASAKSSGAFAMLVCSWKSEDGTIEGQHHIRGLPIRPIVKKDPSNNTVGSVSNINATATAGCPIVITATHPSVVTNHFVHGPATVPLKIRLRNRFVSPDPVNFELSVEAHDRFDWTGPQCVPHSLASDEALEVPLKAIIPAAGVYNLQTVRLTILNNSNLNTDSNTRSPPEEEPSSSPQPPVSYKFPLQWNVVVEETVRA